MSVEHQEELWAAEIAKADQQGLAGKCIAERLYDSYGDAFPQLGPRVAYAELEPQHQAVWNRFAVSFMAKLSNAPPAQVRK